MHLHNLIDEGLAVAVNELAEEPAANVEATWQMRAKRNLQITNRRNNRLISFEWKHLSSFTQKSIWTQDGIIYSFTVLNSINY